MKATPPKYSPPEDVTLEAASLVTRIETEYHQSEQDEVNNPLVSGTLSLGLPTGSSSPSTISKHKLFVTPSFAAGM